MLVYEIAEYFRDIVQEPDTSFLTDTTVTRLLRNSYREFRGIVKKQIPDYYATSVAITPSGYTYDLADIANPVVLLGPPSTLTGPRLSRILSLAYEGPNGYLLQGVTDPRALELSDGSAYMLSGSTLRFFSPNPGTLTLVYDPVESVDWTALAEPVAPAVGVFVDDMVEYHDLIALLAARRYMVLDASVNPALPSELATRLRELEDFLSSRGEDDYMIQRVDDYY